MKHSFNLGTDLGTLSGNRSGNKREHQGNKGEQRGTDYGNSSPPLKGEQFTAHPTDDYPFDDERIENPMILRQKIDPPYTPHPR